LAEVPRGWLQPDSVTDGNLVSVDAAGPVPERYSRAVKPCDCAERHEHRRVVLTGGPGAGKTAALELVRLFFCAHVHTLPESAGIVFGGRFPRDGRIEVREAAQRAIFHVQRELEATEESDNAAIVLCDRGTVDGAAYWPGRGDLFSAVGTTREQELARYHAVIHLRTPQSPDAYGRGNPLRVESIEEAGAIDARISAVWAGHARLFEVPATPDFLTKVAQSLRVLRDLVPECCRQRVKPFLWDHAEG
jgi:predicted ATPase